MNKLNVQENEDKHVRNIALKAARHKKLDIKTVKTQVMEKPLAG